MLLPVFVLLGCSGAPAAERAGAKPVVVITPAPPGEPASEDYAVFVNGKQVFCYTSFRFDTESKITIKGRPVSPVSFCTFDHEGEVEVEVRFLDGLKKAGIDTSKVVVRPLARGIKPKVKDGSIRFRIKDNGPLCVEPGGGITHPLHIFSNPLEKDVPDPKDPNVLYFGPGTHEVGETDLKSGQTVYISAGAVVYLRPVPREQVLGGLHQNYGVDVYWAPGMFGSTWQKNITVRGRGILCGRRALERGQRGHLVKFHTIENLTVEGIIIRESAVWSLNVVNSKHVRISNVKIIGHYVNNDGIAIGGTSDAVVEDCFSHNADDSLEIKVWIPQSDVTFRNCVVWNDVGGSFGLMHECGAELKNVLYKDCTVIHSTDDMSVCPVVGIKLSGAGSVHDIRFENITVEDVRSKRRPSLKVINNWDEWHMDLPTKPGSPYELLNPPKRETSSGSIRNVVFKNIRVLESGCDEVAIISESAESPIEGITFDNVVINGKRLVPNDPRIKKNEWVRDVTVR